ncbi:NAD(P)(+)--arginine ADP-ribosyltransferase 1-like [Perca fluviatilis]|uniref:NAD(P)(+)--arginine ADP-ribosyltransferase 1-like n=1 Tax=Perca fluviatilis TaxID=8168 RepID=UPI0019645036|nr:NAD(P)(+)--arginine ADP-ribosyltransferase 1-like [Perca fluviatilis]
MAVMVVLAAVLLTYGVSPGIAMEAGESGAVAGVGAGENGVLPLDMAENSVDDMYDGCKDKMKERVTKDLENEKNKDPFFKKVWDKRQLKKQIKNKLLEKDQIVAINYYTFGEENAYLPFNAAVRTQGPQYKTTFGYHALHFLLTTAIRALRASKGDECLTVYRRVNEYFSQDVQNKEIRFGSFTSASLGGYGKELFGEKSCFEIVTCMGADVSNYSKFENEREVLIPPYEVFKVVEIKKRSTMQPDLPCEVVYKVRSTRYYSKSNCALFKK